MASFSVSITVTFGPSLVLFITRYSNMIITRMMMISKANRIIFRLCFAALCLLLILLFAIIPSFSFPVPYQ